MTLQNILDATRAESQQREHQYPLTVLQRKVEKMGPTRGFARALGKKPFSVIAEIKRASPSMGNIAGDAIDRALGIYTDHQIVSAISVITQKAHFGGATDDLENVRKLTQHNPKPILRKDFIFSPYEIFFSRWIGADAILLMANVVENKDEFKKFHDLAVSIGLDVLCEVHDEPEIGILPHSVKICGINSRRFKGIAQKPTFGKTIMKSLIGTAGFGADTQTDLTAFDLLEKLEERLPTGCLKIAESGISSQNIGGILKKHRFNAALIGTSLLKNSRPEMIKALDKIQDEADGALLETALGTPAKRQTPVAV